MAKTEAKQKEGCRDAEQTCFCMGAGPELFAMFKKLGPDEARHHFRNARIEMLKGMKALIDKRIDALGDEPEKKGTKVTVE
jgi:hypothetical protein